MASMLPVLPHAINTMKNTIDDADFIINQVVFISTIQLFTNSGHSHSMVAGGFPEMS